MYKRQTLTDLLEEVPIDSARFLFNMHDAGSGIDFDLDQAVKTDNDNPVYYAVSYTHLDVYKRQAQNLTKTANAAHHVGGGDNNVEVHETAGDACDQLVITHLSLIHI